MIIGNQISILHTLFQAIAEKMPIIKEDAMRNHGNMRGFNSLRALYLFEKGEKLECLANKLEEKKQKYYDEYHQEACYLKHEVSKEEVKYNKKN